VLVKNSVSGSESDFESHKNRPRHIYSVLFMFFFYAKSFITISLSSLLFYSVQCSQRCHESPTNIVMCFPVNSVMNMTLYSSLIRDFESCTLASDLVIFGSFMRTVLTPLQTCLQGNIVLL